MKKKNINTISMHGEKFYQLHTSTCFRSLRFNDKLRVRNVKYFLNITRIVPQTMCMSVSNLRMSCLFSIISSSISDVQGLHN